MIAAEAAKEMPDGPIKVGECHDCYCYCSEDVYICQGKVLCGDCRYHRRTGHAPPVRNIAPVKGDYRGPNRAERQQRAYDGGYGSETRGRSQRVVVSSELHAKVLMDLECDRGD